MSQTMTITKTTDETYFVASESDERKGYAINIKEGTCECPQYEHRGLYCKHQDGVDDRLIMEGKIPSDKCNVEEEKDINCAWQQVMLDRGYILYVNKKGINVWKKREAYDAMSKDDITLEKDILLEGSPDSMLHSGCERFHLFKQEKKQLYLENGLSKYNEGDELFIQCPAKECFPEHEFVDIAEKVHICAILKEKTSFGAVNWD